MLMQLMRWLMAGFYLWMLVWLEPPLRQLMLAVGAGVALLWGCRWAADRWRSRVRRQHLALQSAFSTRDAATVESVIGEPPSDALRQWLLRRWSTGVTGLCVRDAWVSRHAKCAGFCTVFELQCTPGSSGIDIAVSRQRHGAWLWEHDDPLPPDPVPQSLVYKPGVWDRLGGSGDDAPPRQRDGRTLSRVGSWMVHARDPAQVYADWTALRTALGWPDSADLFMAQTPTQVLVVWRGHPWSAEEMAHLLNPETALGFCHAPGTPSALAPESTP
jgi:hypothetical protein